jgi:hypothetical protein
LPWQRSGRRVDNGGVEVHGAVDDNDHVDVNAHVNVELDADGNGVRKSTADPVGTEGDFAAFDMPQ